MPHRFPGAERTRLRDEQRMAIQPAGELIGRMSPHPDEICADLGSGTGYIAVPLARSTSKVIALDVQREMLEALLDHADGQENIEPVIADVARLPLADASVDRVVLVNVLHEVENAERMIDCVNKALKPGGRISVVDFPRRPTAMGPPVEERIEPDDAVGMFPGFRVVGRWELTEYYQIELKGA